MTSDFPAEFGRAGGAIVNATLKSGSNQLHGSAWEFFRNDIFDAYDDYFVPDATKSKKPELRQNQFGATAGWRLFKDKTFWFVDYEGTRIQSGTQGTGTGSANLGAGQLPTVPTTPEINSSYTDFSDLLGATGSFTRTDLLGRTFQNGQIFDPATTRCGHQRPDRSGDGNDRERQLATCAIRLRTTRFPPAAWIPTPSS